MTENMQSIDFSIKPTLSAYNDKYFSSLISDHLTDTTNSEEFYNKLVELKNEQKKTLLYMQELYNQKQVLKSEIAKSENSLKDLKSSTNYPFQKDENYKYNLSAISAYETTPYVAESVKNEFLSSGNMSNHNLTSSKPPIPQRASTVTFQNVNEQVKSDAMYDTISDDLKRIEKIWNEFSFNEKNHDLKSIEFNQRFEKVNVRKTDKKGLKKSSRPTSAQVEWIPKVTIPEPFSMSIREKVKADNKKVTLARELQDEREKRIEAEIRECKKKFKATPIPAHVHLPLYEKKIAEEKLRKLKLKETSKEYLEKNSKPFNLTDMKKTSLRERRHSFTEGESNKTDRTEFSANPLPNFYFEDDEFVTQKLQESELYKQIKSQMRALELLRQSKLPHNMELQNEKKQLEEEKNQFFIKEMNKLQRQMNRKQSRKKNTRRHSHEVPDYDTLYKKFIVELENKKNQNRKHVKAEPFVLETALRGRNCNESHNHNEKPQMSRSSSMSRLSQSLRASIDPMPIRSNEAHNLRESVNKKKMNDIVRKELQHEHIEKFKKMHEKKMREQIQEKIKYDPKEIEKNLERKARQLRLDQRSREEEYEKEIENMSKNMQNRKLQIEQIEEENIKKAIEKKYQDALRKAGLNERDLKSKVQVAKSVTATNYDEDWINS